MEVWGKQLPGVITVNRPNAFLQSRHSWKMSWRGEGKRTCVLLLKSQEEKGTQLGRPSTVIKNILL